MTGTAPRPTDDAKMRIRAARRRPTRPAFALLAVLAMAVPFLFTAKRVHVVVDGEVVALRTYEATVGDVVVASGVALAPDDEIVPPPSTPVEDGLEIEVLRAAPVTFLAQNGRKIRLRVVAATVREALTEAGLGRMIGGKVVPPLDAPVEPGMRIELRDPMPVAVAADGDVVGVSLLGGRVADALARAGVDVGPHDLVLPPLSATLRPGMNIVVRRIGAERLVEEVILPFQERTVENADLWEGQSRVVQEGVEGLRRDVYRLRLVDGQPAGRDLLRQEVVREPVDRVVEVGTRKRPVAPAVPTDSIWDALAQCESHGNWQARGTYHGGLQFHPDTWNRWKPAGYPDYAYQATREQQIEVARRLQAAQGWSPWPHCARQLGLL